ncbi:RNA-binding protein squid isoform X3 [Schistocerca americana]|uniref:RNA-binding protein squid isoform X3 n=1 Tax=Schistocerca americana TaxID=7009 RepID=UPI001F4F9B47|nr:RNA-binding protein squid isoform X3 [Schistocerca americana]XP_046993398.1 RNA-binding protein squid isoform X3 [Schistocerca americana]XP_047117054.1 RNA-binding protein squid isoform X3 [Schistocerca piceifrons]XP_047117063.1 RNA-binding protein squid isoform X3 [Schistocerca piceifrons]XP_049780602.1 RNA-binding protein squid isoform X3 [Schistocerca cancellata]XP_049780603.1 RNA-binding protein squid isoform X3 [Schistocerca cancellata]XP_049814478.1 RNA-binding protein squid-like iso
MAENQEYEMGNGEYQQDGGEQKFQSDEQQQQQQVNGEGEGTNEAGGGGGDAPADSGSAEAPGRDDDRKLFVGGLSWETTDKELREHFQTYGEIESINVKTDPSTGRSRGFAFIVFSQAESIDKVLSAGDHIINNKKVDPKKAKARHGKIFVGGLVPELSDDDIKNYFAQYGTIVEVEMPFDKTKNQRKGFCFITFESEQVVQELLKSPKQSINGKEVDVKKATPKPDGMGGVRGGRGGRGGRGRGRGGRGAQVGGYGSQGWGNQGGYGGYGGYDQGGYGGYGGYDYYGSGYGNYGGYGGYDYTPYSGYGNYGSTGGGYSGGKQRGGSRQTQRHQPY